jgi:hypothetical protein
MMMMLWDGWKIELERETFIALTVRVLCMTDTKLSSSSSSDTEEEEIDTLHPSKKKNFSF